MPKGDTTIKGYYWFDTQTDVHEVAVTNGTFEVDASSLSDGFHRFHYQALLSSGTTSKPVASFFLKTAQVNADDELNCICSVDGQLRHIEKLSQQGGIIHWDLDMHDLTDGLHRIQLQTVTMSGAMSGSYTSYFMRVTTPEELGEMRCVYAIDDDAFNSNASVVGNNGNYHFDLDLSELSDGLHHISYMLYNDRGTNTKIQTRFFLKVPLGGNGINQYQYWLNDEGIETAKTVTLPQKVNPLQLMSLLPVESRPLRSSLFLFDVSSGKPMVYAKNTIHLRFYDAAMRFTDAAKDYADYSIGQEVDIIKTLESGIRETTAWPEENEIKWYQVMAERGDSLSFKLDLAATLQLFSPSGQEVYRASGSEVVKWGGCHAKENGTYYVALHDVAATQGDDISIDYEHIDRYAVLRQDVAVIGNSGFSTITFEGNGFDELKDVCLVLGNDTIHAEEIDTEGKATTKVKFNFDGVELGQYKAVFTFEEALLYKEKSVIVEEATPIELDVEADFARQYLISFHKTKYVFSIHNYGNITAYNVPLMIRIYTHTAESLERVDIEGFDLEKQFRESIGTHYSDTIAGIIKNMKAISGDRCFFAEADSTDIVAGWAAHLHETFVLPNIPPNSTIKIGVNLQLGQAVYCYMWCPEDWYDDANATNQVKFTKRAGGTSGKCGKSFFYHKYKCNQRAVWDQNRKNIGDDLMGNGDPYPNEDCTDYTDYPMKCEGTGGNSNPGGGVDPNDIFGYTAESGSHAIKDGLNEVYYTIEFENDPEIATAPAHEIFVADTLDATKFDLSTYAPTRVKIGEKSAELSGDKNFVTTIDMRPEINAIAQVEGTFDEQKGIARWHITSLDPMTMEPTDDVMQGVLPVNHNGNGIGELSYDIKLKPDLAHGTEVDNRASIVFDQNEPIMTPTWTNTIDRIAPESHVTNVKMLNDSTAAVSIAATDELSGPWRYDVYVQYGSGAWFLGAKDVPIDTTASVKVYEGINHGVYVVVTDSAGNVEQKEAAWEYTFEVFGSQTETSTKIQLAQGWNWISHNQNAALSVEAVKPHALTIVSRTAELQKNSQQGWIGYLEELLPTEMYKVQATEASGIQLSGLLFNAAFRSIPLAKGWNWIGYPVVNVMSVSEALTKLKADEDDAIMSQDGIALFSDGNWTGTLTTMTPGIGYMYRSGSDKSFFLNASAQASARKIEATPKSGGMAWTADKRKYRNVMGLIGHLYKDESLESNDDWIVGAFCNDECRGIAQDVDGHLMMNVFGEDGETIVFRAMRLTTGEILPIVEEVPMCSDLLGNFHSPYDLHIGSKTGIVSTEHYQPTNNEDVYDVQGRKVDKSRMKKGVYVIVNDHQKQIQKVIK